MLSAKHYMRCNSTLHYQPIPSLERAWWVHPGQHIPFHTSQCQKVWGCCMSGLKRWHKVWRGVASPHLGGVCILKECTQVTGMTDVGSHAGEGGLILLVSLQGEPPVMMDGLV